MVEILFYVYVLSVTVCFIVDWLCNYHLKCKFYRLGKGKEYREFQVDYKKNNRKGINDIMQYLIFFCPILNVLIVIIEVASLNKAFFRVLGMLNEFLGKGALDEVSN